MKNIRAKADALSSGLAAWVYDHKFIALALMALVTGVLALQVPNLTIDTREESFFHEDDPTLIAYNRFRDQFGQDDMFFIALRPENGISTEFLSFLSKLHAELETAVPYLDDITSLVNGRVVQARGDTLLVEDLMPAPPGTEEELKRIMGLIKHYPVYENMLISEDRSLALILIKAQAVLEDEKEKLMTGFEREKMPEAERPSTYLSNQQNVEIDTVVRAVLEKHKRKGIEFYMAGNPVFVAEIQRGIEKDLALMIPLSLLIIIFFLAILFRRISGVILPLIIVLCSLIACLGVMAIWKIPITNAIQILPTFLIVVGIGDAVHILTGFFRYHRETNDKQLSIIRAFGASGLPVLMTSVTTALGLVSFIWTDVAVIAQLGCIAPVGVMLALLYTLLLLPALIAIFPFKSAVPLSSNRDSATERFFNAVTRLTTRQPMWVMLIAVILTVLAGASALNVRFSHNAMTWLPENSTARVSTELLDRKNGGTIMLEVLIDSGKPNGLHDPDLLARMDAAGKYIPTISIHGIHAGKVLSMADLLKETNRALHQDRAEAYVVPNIRELAAQELVLFESSGNDDLAELTDSTYQTGRLSILAPFTDSILYKEYTDKIEDYLQRQFPREKITLTGHMALFIGLTKRFITSMAKSYIFAFLLITIAMMVMLGKVRLGLMSMIPNAIPVVMVFGIMGVARIPLDMATILIGSIVLGLVVDDTIHFLHHFQKEFEKNNCVETAIKETLAAIGPAMAVTSLVLCGGFFIYTTSFLANNIRFGLLTGSAVIFALAADVLLMPSFLILVHQKLCAPRERICSAIKLQPQSYSGKNVPVRVDQPNSIGRRPK